MSSLEEETSPAPNKGKTKLLFPKSKIKHIMQKDEDVGKIAMEVPIMISKGLELFLQDLILSASDVLSSRNGKMLAPSHLKQAIQDNSKFDFLSHIVESVPDLEEMKTSGKKARKRGASNAHAKKEEEDMNPGEKHEKVRTERRVKEEPLEEEIELPDSPLPELPSEDDSILPEQDDFESDEEDWDELE